MASSPSFSARLGRDSGGEAWRLSPGEGPGGGHSYILGRSDGGTMDLACRIVPKAVIATFLGFEPRIFTVD